MDMPKPIEGHRRLERLAGTWEGEEIMAPSPWHCAGSTAVGRTTNRVALSGFALIGEYEQRQDGVVTFTGHCVYTYSPQDDLYTMHWYDCMGSPEAFTGRFDGDLLTLSHGGPGPHMRMTYDLSDPRMMIGRMDSSEDGVDWKTVFDGRYKRL